MGSVVERLLTEGAAGGLLPKRTRREPMDSWYPYYAGFASSFAGRVLNAARLAPRAMVLDPWNGAGTTTTACTSIGVQSIGTDINPVATLVASAKLARQGDASHALGLAKRIARRARIRTDCADEPANPWLSPAAAVFCSAVRHDVLRLLGTTPRGRTLQPLVEAVPPLASFLLVAMLRAARSLARITRSTNPTWIRPGEKRRITRTALEAAFLATVEKMADEMPTSLGSPAALHVADARKLPVGDASVDLALTSPPYCTRIDYVVNTSFELAALGLQPSSNTFAALRRDSMGTPLARERTVTPAAPEWSSDVGILLQQIQAHPSRDSSSYYYKTYWQYFQDAYDSLRELRRVLRPGGVAVLVLQTSFYKEVHVDLPELYCGMATKLGFAGTTLCRNQLGRVMTQINSRVMSAREPSDYVEAVIALEAQ